MKKECEIVQDLLFGYQDGTLHTASKELVENHIETCEECKSVYNDMKKDESKNKDEQHQEIEYLKKVKKKMSKKNKLLIIIGVILTIVILLNIGIVVYYYKEAGKIEIYLEDNITQEQIENIKSSISNIDEKAKIEYYSKEDSLNQMKEKFSDNQNLLSGYGGENNPLPAFLVVDTTIENAKKMESTLSLPEIKKICGTFDSNPYLFILSEVMINLQNN